MQRRVAVGIVCALSATVLSACGFDAPAVTEHEHSSIQGTNLEFGLIAIRAAYVAPPVALVGAGSSPYLVVTFVNNGKLPDTFTGATTSIGTVTVSGPGTLAGRLKLLPGVPAIINDPAINANGPIAAISTSTVPAAGTYVRITFNFSTGSSRTVQVPVVPPGQTTNVFTPLPDTPAPVPTQVGDTTND